MMLLSPVPPRSRPRKRCDRSRTVRCRPRRRSSCYHPRPMRTRTRTWPAPSRRLLDWAGDHLARLVDRSLGWLEAHLSPPTPALHEPAPAPEPDFDSDSGSDCGPDSDPGSDSDSDPDSDPAPPLPAPRAWLTALTDASSSALTPADVHRVRVSCRRLRTFVVDLKTVGLDDGRHHNRALRRCAAAFARVRELDARLERLRAHPPADPALHARLERRLAKRRTAAGEALRSQLDRLRLPQLVAALGARLDAFAADLATADPRPWAERIVAARSAAWLASLPPEIADDQLEVLHKIRIRAKQLRYSVMWLGDLAPRPARRWAKLAKRVQRVLGEHRDAALLHRLLVERHARAHELGHTDELEALSHALVASRLATFAAFSPIPALLDEVRRAGEPVSGDACGGREPPATR
ncbi:MAG TPA: CHAD domain-containing protein [Nannocystaceae bacterium]|nr:CHAD domain-containing protein [Nannocystaceae bacterium]